jgi:hypothetical protein
MAVLQRKSKRSSEAVSSKQQKQKKQMYKSCILLSLDIKYLLGLLMKRHCKCESVLMAVLERKPMRSIEATNAFKQQQQKIKNLNLLNFLLKK